MESATLVTGTVVGLALLHLLLLGYLGSRRNPHATAVGGDGESDSGGTTVEDDADVVRCRECGAENERGYQYCRHCVAELPGGSPLQHVSSTPIGVR